MGGVRLDEREGRGWVKVTSARMLVLKSPDVTTRSILPGRGGMGEGGVRTASGSSVCTRKPEALAMGTTTWRRESCLEIHSPPRLHFRKWVPSVSVGSPHAQVGGRGMPKGRPKRKRIAVENSMLEKEQPGMV